MTIVKSSDCSPKLNVWTAFWMAATRSPGAKERQARASLWTRFLMGFRQKSADAEGAKAGTTAIPNVGAEAPTP